MQLVANTMAFVFDFAWMHCSLQAIMRLGLLLMLSEIQFFKMATLTLKMIRYEINDDAITMFTSIQV